MTTFHDFGIMQGRLVVSHTGKVQCFPNYLWIDEFFISQKIGLEFIELMIDEYPNKFNPLSTVNGLNELIKTAQKSNQTIYSICNNYIIEHSIDDTSTINNIHNAINLKQTLDYKLLILPFYGKSEMTNSNLEKYRNILINLIDLCTKNKIYLCIEADVEASILNDFINSFDSKYLGVVYDTGNRIACNANLYNEINILNNNIYHVHIKDKNTHNENVLLGTGLVNFYEVFTALKNINYTGKYVFESQRGKIPENTAFCQASYINFIKNEAI
jgi:L-ribulose-5-phosphate 3-epimerase